MKWKKIDFSSLVTCIEVSFMIVSDFMLLRIGRCDQKDCILWIFSISLKIEALILAEGIALQYRKCISVGFLQVLHYFYFKQYTVDLKIVGLKAC